jgi:hypothetical protein
MYELATEIEQEVEINAKKTELKNPNQWIDSFENFHTVQKFLPTPRTFCEIRICQIILASLVSC